MSCDRTANRTANASISAGLTRLAAKSAYARAARRNLALARRALAAVRRFLAGTPAAPTAVPQLDAVQTVAPTAPPPGQTCAGCGRDTGQPGPWYRIAGQTHCADCAPAAAQHAGVTLAVAGPRAAIRLTAQNAVSSPARRAPDAVRLEEQPVDVACGDPPRLLRLENAFAVLRGDTPTGLAITPALVDGRPATDRWAVTHLDTGRAFADGFRDVHEAEGLAALLAHIDWSRPFDTMPQTTLKEAGEIIGRYDAQLTALRGTLADRAWRTRELTGQWVNDGLGDLAIVVEDNGEKLILAGAAGHYAMPRTVVHPPDAAEFTALRLAIPRETDTLPSTAACPVCGQSVAQTLDDRWFTIGEKTCCETCAAGAAKDAGLTMPDDYRAAVLRN